MSTPENCHSEELLDSASVERFIGRMRRRETLHLALLTFFLTNALGAAVFSVYVWATHRLAAGFHGPAILVEVVSLGLIAMLWHRTNWLRRLGQASALPTRQFLETALEETRVAIREQWVVIAVTLGLLTPLFLLAERRLVADGAMALQDAIGLGCLYMVGLAVVVGVSWDRVRRLLRPQSRALRQLLGQLAE